MTKKSKSLPVTTVFPRAGVLTRLDDPTYARAIRSAYSTPENVVVSFSDSDPVNFPTPSVTMNPKTGTLSFISADTPYQIRELREDDGEWLSRYKTLLPLRALSALAGPELRGGDDVPTAPANETLVAYSLDDSDYIVGVVYTTSTGSWVRVDGDWTLLAPDDDTFDDMIVTPIDPLRADDFLQFYDRNHVTVTDAEKYEDPTEDTETDE